MGTKILVSTNTDIACGAASPKTVLGYKAPTGVAARVLRYSAGFRGRKAFPDLPHALRARYLNRDAGYQQDERIVYDDGYSEASATKFETIEFFGVTSADEVWKHGRYTIAVARLRPEVFELSTDIEHLACTRGDLVLVTHDVPQWGLSFGRVVELITDTDNNLLGLRFDEQVTMDAGEQYVVRVRREP